MYQPALKAASNASSAVLITSSLGNSVYLQKLPANALEPAERPGYSALIFEQQDVLAQSLEIFAWQSFVPDPDIVKVDVYSARSSECCCQWCSQGVRQHSREWGCRANKPAAGVFFISTGSMRIWICVWQCDREFKFGAVLLLPAALKLLPMMVTLLAKTCSLCSRAECMSPAAAETGCVQYVVVRRDLYAELDWPLGSIIAQVAELSFGASALRLLSILAVANVVLTAARSK